MSITELYRTWISSSTLTEEDVRRMGFKALKEEDEYLLDDVLAHSKCPLDVVEAIKKSGKTLELSIWSQSRHCTKKEFAWFIANHSAELIIGTECFEDVYSKSRMQIAWDKNDVDLRLYLLEQLQYFDKDIPKKWGKWFFKTLHEEGFDSSSSDILEDCAGDGSLNTFWDIAVKLDDLQSICSIYSAYTPDDIHERNTNLVREKIKEYLDHSGRDKLDVTKLASAVDAILAFELDAVDEGSSSAGSKAQALGRRIVSLLPEKDPNRTLISKKLAMFASENLSSVEPESLSDEDLLELLPKGELPEEALERICVTRKAPGLTPLWEAVASHPKLNPSQGCKLISHVHDESAVEAVDILIKGRSNTWMKDTTYGTWLRKNYSNEVGFHLLKRLPKETLEKVIKKLIGESVTYAERFLQKEFLVESVLNVLPVNKIKQLTEAAQCELFTLTQQKFDGNAAAWEVFETLLDSPGKVTYGTILEASMILVEENKK